MRLIDDDTRQAWYKGHNELKHTCSMSGYVTQDDAERPTAKGSTGLDRWLLEQLLQLVGDPNLEFELWDGYVAGSGRSAQRICFNDRGALVRSFLKPTYTFGVLYTAGRITCRGSLVATMEAVYRALSAVRKRGGTLPALGRRLFAKRPRANSLGSARDNVNAHYDLGNDFYSLWLDRAYMQYTCAYYAESTYSLEDAQIAKLEFVCRKLDLKPGETVVEAGSGWGGLGRYLARHYGVNVRSYNISSEQVAYARARAAEDRLDDLVEYVEDDYRNITGTYDVFVSVGMLEHVGPNNFDQLGMTIDRCLRDDGRGLIHSIGQISPRPLNEWIERCIFPGARPPSLKQMMEIFEPFELVVKDAENLRPHYARTLEHWLQRFEAREAVVKDMFDEDFVRAWRLYLAGSAAAFTTGDLQLFQVLFQRSTCERLPETRARMYHPGLLRETFDRQA
jgi:cyclopropane-fatty-acyl-phospholipid synthase